MKVNFITPTRISLIDITSMGDSSKRGNDSTIGKFDSGLKYAIALLLRNDVSLKIYVEGDKILHDNYDEYTTDVYSFGTYIEECDKTGKTKELIEILCENIPHGGSAHSQHDMREPSLSTEWTVKTGFAKALGYNWELWMALRELWSNMLDEGGSIDNYYLGDEHEGTVMTIEFEEDSEFGKVWAERHLYVNEKEPLFEINSRVQVLENPEGYLRIYKQNILIYKSEKTPSRFAYNIKFGEIDERRILSNLWTVKDSIVESIRHTENESFLRAIITPDFEVMDNEFLSIHTIYHTASDRIHNIATDIYNHYGKVSSYDWLMLSIKKREDCKINGKVIKSVSDHVYNYSEDVTVVSKPKPLPVSETKEDKPISFSDLVGMKYNFDIDVEVRVAKLKGSKVIADKYEKCLIVDEAFDIETDMPSLLVQYIDLTKTGNLVQNLSEFICELIRK